jgi:DNA-binding FadR family transcriptional regulator
VAEDCGFGYLPAEPELQEKFRVSRTVHKAVDMLGKQGFVYIKQGKATQILEFKAGYANCEDRTDDLGPYRSYRHDDHLSDFRVGGRG